MDELPRILIIEDEPAIADTLIYALKTEGFAPEWCATGRAGLRLGAIGSSACCALLVVALQLRQGPASIYRCSHSADLWSADIVSLTNRR